MPNDFAPGVIVTHAAPLSATEMENERQARYRPADRSADATRKALTAVQADAAGMAVRVGHLQSRVRHLLTGGSPPPDVRRARDELGAAEQQLADLGVREAGLRVALEQREQAEADAAENLIRLAAVAEQHAARFRQFLAKDYGRAAALIAAGMEHERAALRADAALREAGRLWPGVPCPRPDIPRAVDGSGYGHRACLPGYYAPSPLAQSPYAN